MADPITEKWMLAFAVALDRCGLLASERDGFDAWVPPTLAVADDPAGTRVARRRYRKLWRRSLARELREFELTPKRRQRKMKHEGAYVKGRWVSREDPLEGMMLRIQALAVGRRPWRHARGKRWWRVKTCPELRRTLLQVAKEFGLLDPKRDM